MTIPNHKSSSPLSLYIILSVGIHIVGASLFAVFSPKIQPTQSVQITLSSKSGSNIVAKQDTVKQEIPSPVTPKTTQPITPKPVQKQISQPKPVQTQNQQVAKTPVQQPVVQKTVQTQKPQTTPVQQPATPPKPVQQPIAQKPIQPQQTSQATPPVPATTPQQVVAQQPTSNPENTIITNSNKDLSQELDQLLAQKTTTSTPTDALADATWGGTPRKTIAFPNIVASIPEQYKNRGYGFSVTAKITFSQQGWVSAVELVQGSGDPRIDGIFRTELRKIRVEPTSVARTDTITKTFKVSVK